MAVAEVGFKLARYTGTLRWVWITTLRWRRYLNLIERDFGDAKAPGNFVDAELLLAAERFSHDGRALGLLRKAPPTAPVRLRPEASPA